MTKPLNIDDQHGGGRKIENTSEQTYVDFLAWVNEYAACRADAGEGEGDGDPGPQAPSATINHPGAADGPRPAGVAVPFIGVASDPQDGALTGSSLVWTSDLVTGPFGTGTSVSAALPVGTNNVTLTVTDSDGNTGTASRIVVIQ